jgi:hypothetical protein
VSDLALADASSFADVLPQWKSRRDLEAARRHGGREDRPAPEGEGVVIATRRRKAAECLEAPFAGDDEPGTTKRMLRGSPSW